MYVEGVGQKSGPCTATFVTLIVVLNAQMIMIDEVKRMWKEAPMAQL
jgi:hypothetical protein